MKTLIVIALLFVAGCLPASQQEVQTLTDMVNQIVPAVREAVSASSEETRDKVEIVLGQVEEYNEAVKDSPNLGAALISANQVSAPVNPYAPVIDIALKMLFGGAVTGGVFGTGKLVKTVREKNEITNKYSAAKIGMDKFRNENPDKAAELYTDVGEARRAKKIA